MLKKKTRLTKNRSPRSLCIQVSPVRIQECETLIPQVSELCLRISISNFSSYLDLSRLRKFHILKYPHFSEFSEFSSTPPKSFGFSPNSSQISGLWIFSRYPQFFLGFNVPRSSYAYTGPPYASIAFSRPPSHWVFPLTLKSSGFSPTV